MKQKGLWVIAFVIVALMVLTSVSPLTTNRTEIIDNSTYIISNTPPDNPELGDLWFDTTLDEMNIYNGYVWQSLVPTVSGAGYKNHVAKHYWGGVDPIEFHKLSPNIRIASEFAISGSGTNADPYINAIKNSLQNLVNNNIDGTVFCPSGHYCVENVEINSEHDGMAIVGAGEHGVWLHLPSTATHSMFVIGQTDRYNDFSFINLRLMGGNYGSGLHAFEIYKSRNLWMQDVYAKYFTGDGLHCVSDHSDGIIDSHIIGCVWEGLEGNGIYLAKTGSGNVYRNVFIGGYSFGNDERGIYINGTNANYFDLIECGQNKKDGILIVDSGHNGFTIKRIMNNGYTNPATYYNVKINGTTSDGNRFSNFRMMGTDVLYDVYVDESITGSNFCNGEISKGFDFHDNGVREGTTISSVEGWKNVNMGYASGIKSGDTITHYMIEAPRLVTVTPYNDKGVHIQVTATSDTVFWVTIRYISNGTLYNVADVSFFWKAWGRTATEV